MSDMPRGSESTSLVLAHQIVSMVAEEIEINKSPAVQRLIEKGASEEDACESVLIRATKTALRLARNDDEIAKNALIIVNARGNRLPQAVNLLKQHSAALVTAAYRLHEELTESTCSLIHMCRIIEALGYIPDEDDYEIAEMLDAIALACVSKKQEFFWLKRIPELFRERLPFPETILIYVLGQIQNRPDYFGPLMIDDEDKEEYWESLSSNDQEK